MTWKLSPGTDLYDVEAATRALDRFADDVGLDGSPLKLWTARPDPIEVAINADQSMTFTQTVRDRKTMLVVDFDGDDVADIHIYSDLSS